VTKPNDCSISEDELFGLLSRRRGRLDGVCISGGEPLLHDISETAKKIKALGFLVKLDTNGSFPQKLKSLAEKKLIDYVAMDIKNSPAHYEQTCGAPVNMEAITESVDFLMHGKVDFEFRTTVVSQFHTSESMLEIGKWLKGDEKYFLQAFSDSGSLIQDGLSGVSKEQMSGFADIVSPYIPRVSLRGID